MNNKNKFRIGIIGGSLALLVGGGYLTYKTIATPPAEYVQSIEGDENSYYQLYTVTKQEPTSIDGKVSLTTDQVYYFNSELGDFNHLFVQDGQKVRKGDSLFNYRQEKVIQEIEDAQRNLHRLLRNRQSIIQKMADATGKTYDNYGNELAGYWAEDGNYYYYVINEVSQGKGANSKEIITPGQGTETINEEAFSSIQEINDQIEDLQIQLERLNNQDQLNIKAKSDGTVKVNIEGKDNPSIPLVRVVSNKVSVVGEVGEYDFYALHEDMPVKVHINAENRDVTGQLISFDDVPKSQMPTSEGGNLMGAEKSDGIARGSRYGFTVAVDEFIQPGYSVKVQIGLSGVRVPQEAQITDESGNTVAFVYKDGKAHKVTLKLSQQGTAQVDLSQLHEGDQLILNPYDLKDGQDVKIMDANAKE